MKADLRVPLCWTVVGVTLGWSLWVVLMVLTPQIFAIPMIRAVARLMIVLLPAVLFVQRIERRNFAVAVGLTVRPAFGSFLGLLAFTLYPGALLAYRWWRGAAVVIPADAALWLNFVIGSPLAEEMLYRGVVYRVLRIYYGYGGAAVFSSLAFALLHLPWWLAAGEMSNQQIGLESLSIFVYGLTFAGLFAWSRSLWSPLVFHWLNNLVLFLLH